MLHEWQQGVHSSLWRNPLMPQDLRGSGNIERTMTKVVPDVSTGYALWLSNEVDVSEISDLELEAHLEQFPGEGEKELYPAVLYIGIASDKPPFDNVHVRRAFSAAYDRQTLADQVMQGLAKPMTHFAPPGIFGAPPIDKVGVGFDPEYAREQLAEGGYPNCEGLPPVTLMIGPGPEALPDGEYAQAQWMEHLGCSPQTIQIEQLPFYEMLEAAMGPTETRPHMWTMGWAADYPDENNWVGDVLWCNSGITAVSMRECNALDDLIVEARVEPDPERRIALYREIEEGFFGREGYMPFIPLVVDMSVEAVHSWLDQGPEDPFSGMQFYNWTIDWEAKQDAR